MITLITIAVSFISGIAIGCIYMEEIYKKDLTQMSEHIEELEKLLSK